IAEARGGLMKYDTIKFHNGLAISDEKTDHGFTVTTRTGETYSGQKLIFATGIKDIMPDIPGCSEDWGICVILCPYCNGYEYRNEITAILANDTKGCHLATVVNNLTDDLMLLTIGSAVFVFHAAKKLKAIDIGISE